MSTLITAKFKNPNQCTTNNILSGDSKFEIRKLTFMTIHESVNAQKSICDLIYSLSWFTCENAVIFRMKYYLLQKQKSRISRHHGVAPSQQMINPPLQAFSSEPWCKIDQGHIDELKKKK